MSDLKEEAHHNTLADLQAGNILDKKDYVGDLSVLQKKGFRTDETDAFSLEDQLAYHLSLSGKKVNKD